MIIYSEILLKKDMRLKLIAILIIISFLISGNSLLGNQTLPAVNNSENYAYGQSNFSSLNHLSSKNNAYCLPTNWRGECKNIMAVGNATKGNYSLLLKVRDPARPGLQVLCAIPKGYEYDYHRPWTGFKMHFKVEHRFIGTTTRGDTPPNITKPGMILSDAGLAFGDADTISYLINPSPNAWDDFDWMRYAAQSADDIDDAVELLTNDVVDKMHAPSVAENIFVVGADKGMVIEADAFNYRVRQINSIEVQSNYPKDLWDVHTLYPLFIAPDFNSTFTGWVEEGERIGLGGLMGIRISNIGPQFITARLSPMGINRQIFIGEGKVLGNFWIELMDIEDGKAKIFTCFKYLAWESKMKEFVRQRMGGITVKDMMNWSRIHSDDLDGLRGMCQGGYEVATIYQIPTTYTNFLSTLWFAPDQCSSIFIPVHICDRDIYDPYENGEAHSIALQLLENYGHGNLTKVFGGIEDDFISETNSAEKEAIQLLNEGKKDEAINLLTLSDINIQMKALLIEKTWLNISYLSQNISKFVADEILDSMGDKERMEETANHISFLIKEMRINKHDSIILQNICKNLHSLALLM